MENHPTATPSREVSLLISHHLHPAALMPFYVHNRTGEFTRGMLVVDRRDDVGAYAPGENRSYVQQELDRFHVSHGPFESPAVPIPVVDDIGKKGEQDIGVFTVVETPGPRACLELVLQRIWGVSAQS